MPFSAIHCSQKPPSLSACYLIKICAITFAHTIEHRWHVFPAKKNCYIRPRVIHVRWLPTKKHSISRDKQLFELNNIRVADVKGSLSPSRPYIIFRGSQFMHQSLWSRFLWTKEIIAHFWNIWRELLKNSLGPFIIWKNDIQSKINRTLNRAWWIHNVSSSARYQMT